MSPEFQERIDELFEQAINLEPGQRPGFLDKACSDTPALRADVSALLRDHERAEAAGFLGRPAWDRLETVRAAPAASPVAVPRHVAAYEILGELGRGGMGIVYKARQTGLKRLVALKMVLGGADSRVQDLARFQSEAEIIARLSHPNIVHIYEVGRHDDRPFFAMELVEGGSLAGKLAGTPLSSRPAAELVEVLARAVEVAHQAGIVHRDLKPSNVLLTTDGVPKIMDFGLAKHLEAGTNLTQSGTIMGTPSYMPPEQAQGRSEAIGPACDVYALGAILYECLTGRPPFTAESVMETVYLVLHQEPVPPRALQPKVPRDLETICLKCLQKGAGKRYASALALANDLRRLLVGEPILARPVGHAERLGRWCRRKPALASLLATLALVVLALLGTGGWALSERGRVLQEADRAREAEARAQNRFRQVRELSHTLLFDIDIQLRRVAGATAIRHELVKTVMTHLASLHAEAGDDPELLHELCTVYLGLGDVLSNPAGPSLGDIAGALDSHRQAKTLAESLVQAEPDNPTYRRDLARCWYKIAMLEKLMSRTTDALASFRENLRLSKALVQADPDNRLLLYEVSDGYYRMGLVQERLRTTEALASYRESVAWAEGLAKIEPGSRDARTALAGSCSAIAKMQRLLGHPGVAIAHYRRGLAELQELAKAFPADALVRGNLAHALMDEGDVYGLLDRSADALASYQKALALAIEVAKPNPDSVSDHLVGRCLLRLGDGQLFQIGQANDALATFQRALHFFEPLAQGDRRNALLQHYLGDCHAYLGWAHGRLGQTDQALESFRHGLAIRQELAGADPANMIEQRDVADCHVHIGLMLAQQGRPKDALASYRLGLAATEKPIHADPECTVPRERRALAYQSLSQLHGELGEWDLAVLSARKASEIYDALAQIDPDNLGARRTLIHSHGVLASLYTNRALDSRRTGPARLEDWQAARAGYERSRELATGVKYANYLFGFNDHRGDYLAAAISQSDAAIDSLRRNQEPEIGYQAPDLGSVPPLMVDDYTKPGADRQKREEHKEKDVEKGYANGSYFIQTKTSWVRWEWSHATTGSQPSFACEVVGRVSGRRTDAWGVCIYQDTPPHEGIAVSLSGNGGLRVEPSFFERSPNPEPFAGPFLRRWTLAPANEFDTLLVVVRGRQVEIYVNSLAVCPPVLLRRDITPARIGPAVFAREASTRAEFKRLTVWTAEHLPPHGPR